MRASTAVVCLALVSVAGAMPQGGRPVGPTRSRLTGMQDNMMDDVGSIASRIRTGFIRTVGTMGSSVNGRPRPAGMRKRAVPSVPLHRAARQLTDGAPNAPPFRRPQQGGAAGGVGGSIRRAFNRVADGMRSVMQNIRRNAPNRPQ